MTDKDLIDMLRTKQICTGFKPDGRGGVNVVYGPDPFTAVVADRIEQLTGEVQRWQGMFDEKHNLMLEHKVRAKTAEAERDRLREALDGLLTSVEHADFADGWCCCGDDMLHHQSPMDCGHTPVDMGEYHAFLAIKKARAALKGETP